jgi:hypothetical protein
MKKFLIIPMLMFVFSCSAQTVTPTPPDLSKVHNDTLVSCVSKLDHSTVEYLKSQRVDIPSQYFADFIISNVVDVNGKHWSINQIEWEDLVCTSKSLP